MVSISQPTYTYIFYVSERQITSQTFLKINLSVQEKSCKKNGKNVAHQKPFMILTYIYKELRCLSSYQGFFFPDQTGLIPFFQIKFNL